MSTVAAPALITYDSVITTISGFEYDKQPTGDTHIPIKGCYQAFSQLVNEYPEFFPDLYFSDRSGVPYSKELEDILFQLGAWRQVQDNNPDFLFFTITKEKKKLIWNEYKDIYKSNKAILEKLTQISKRFQKIIGVK
ncbi:MAG: hypothetical protein HXY34_14085 [Candidatus Thorarchaeota archaeon]|nr:hypothetical protein [Candidatus Thorarchaeota archaeon]